MVSVTLVAAMAQVAGAAQGGASPACRPCFSCPDLSRDLSALLSKVPFPHHASPPGTVAEPKLVTSAFTQTPRNCQRLLWAPGSAPCQPWLSLVKVHFCTYVHIK